MCCDMTECWEVNSHTDETSMQVSLGSVIQVDHPIQFQWIYKLHIEYIMLSRQFGGMKLAYTGFKSLAVAI